MTTAISADKLADLMSRSNPERAYAIDVSSTDADLTALIAPGASMLYVGVAGDVTALLAGDFAAGLTTGTLYKAVPAGTVLPGVFVKVFHTGTTATNIVAMQ